MISAEDRDTTAFAVPVALSHDTDLNSFSLNNAASGGGGKRAEWSTFGMDTNARPPMRLVLGKPLYSSMRQIRLQQTLSNNINRGCASVVPILTVIVDHYSP